MATNDFLAFCYTNTGSNLLSQAAYAADAQLSIGNQPGIARSVLVNKALRQATYIASCLAQYLANITGNNVLDNETPSDVLATIAQAFPGPAAGVRYTDTTGVALSGTPTLITFPTKDFDVGGGSPLFVSGVYTVPSNGYYLINAKGVYSASIAGTIYIYKNGSAYSNYLGVSQFVSITDYLKLAAGDIISIYISTAVSTTLSTTGSFNAFSVVKVGSY